MAKVIIQPASNTDSRQHFTDTVQNPVQLNDYKNLIVNDFQSLIDISDNGLLAFWGVTPGQNGANISKYQKIRVGDIVIFTRDSTVFSYGEVAYLFENIEFARKLWGDHPNGQTWQYMYALKDVNKCEISYHDLRNAIGSSEGDNFMGFRPLDQSKSSAVLELLDLEKNIWNIEVGQIIKRSDLHDSFGGGRYGGIEPSAQTPNIFLFTSPKSSEHFGYNFDEELEDGTFNYTGDGQTGDQDLHSGGNKSLIEHRHTNRALRLFQSTDQIGFVQYLGEFELGNFEPIYRIGPDKDRVERKVLVFHLIPVGVTKKISQTSVDQRIGNVTRQGIEQNTSQTHERSIPESKTIATRVEGQLQKRYEEFLRSQGFDIGTLKIQVPESSTLKLDIVDFTNKKVIEVKAGITRNYIREAIGQVLDYVFQIKRINNEVFKPCILIPGKPSLDLIELLKDLSIELIWEEENQFVTN